jgi:DtxR family Mn-dependent transcriptional regulator
MAVSENREMYLKTIYELEVDDEPVAVSHIAERMGISAVSATEMIKRLAESELVVHTPYKGVVLTDEGRVRALTIVRRQRLWGRFLADHLKVPWEYIYDFACRLEHATDDVVTEALAAFLENPETCPHGNPVPDKDGRITEVDDIPLNEAPIGMRGWISRIDRPETTLCEYLKERNLLPGTAFTLEDQAPYNGPFSLRIGDREVAIGREIAGRIRVVAHEE